jgi:hypothetical protein
VATYKVTPEQLPGLFRENERARYKRVVKAVQDTVMTSGVTTAVLLTRAGTARRPAPINVGSYIRAWQAKHLDNGAVLFNDAPHAIFVERGRRPGARMPPKAVIAEWLDQKMRGRIRARGKRLQEAARLAFVVARAIGKRGLPAHRIMARTKRKLDPMVRKAVEAALAG